MPHIPEQDRVDEMLYSTLRAIYHFERSLYERFGLGYQEICLLQLLKRRDRIRIGAAAGILELKLFAATRLVKKLEDGGYLRRETDATDGRAVMIRLSRGGRALLGKIEDQNRKSIEKSALTLSQGQLDAFVYVANNMGNLLGVSHACEEKLES